MWAQLLAAKCENVKKNDTNRTAHTTARQLYAMVAPHAQLLDQNNVALSTTKISARLPITRLAHYTVLETFARLDALAAGKHVPQLPNEPFDL